MDVMKFTQAVSRIWVLETKLLDKPKVERMIEAPSASEVLRILNETEYANVSSNIKRPEDYEEILTAELKRVYDLVYEISPVKEVVKIMSLKYDYHNVKVLLKAKVLGKDFSSMLIKLGNIDLQEIKRKIDGDNLKSLNGTIGKGVQEAMKVFEETKDPQKIDIIIDKYMYKELVEIKNSLNYKFIDNLVKAMIDSTNIRTLLRIKKQNKGRDFASEVIVEGGAIDSSKLVSLLNESPENIMAKLQSTIYSDLVKEGFEGYIQTESASLLEKLSDNYIMDLMKDSKLVTFGPEKILSYIYAKETEIKIIRIIMVGKLNNIAEEVIRERLRDIYA
ncbi:V-type ATP synthase subunit C [Clostridium sp. Sa3CUN1]|uniref:V-type ATP synthase subunit C n=1 Tax=Clostridium gallinarum TaxID=2762246 RepID=A0ABR8Q019_9CLOT|nr:V-type ATP synthase subunit C [Clostridium gallinarum]MBD7913768.1 V-type ATP synthase subunit C [Clostridium gallinarum]